MEFARNIKGGLHYGETSIECMQMPGVGLKPSAYVRTYKKLREEEKKGFQLGETKEG